MDDLIKAVERFKLIEKAIAGRQESWQQTKQSLQSQLQKLGEESALDFEILVTDHIEHWESVSFKLNNAVFSYYVKGSKKQPIVKHGGYLIYGLMPSGFIKVGMVFPKIDDIKEKETAFLQFELVKDSAGIDDKMIEKHLTRFLNEINQWELGEGGEIKERIGFKMTK